MFSKNLKYLRKKHDMEQIDLAKKLGRKSASSISEWEKGKYTPKMKTLSELARLFNVSINDLMEKDLSNTKIQIDTLPVTAIPVVAKISAGLPIYTEENIIEYTYIPSQMTKGGKELFGLKVSGDSMDKEFREGDVVVVEKDSVVENGQIGVVNVNGYNATVKRIRYNEDKIILLPESNNSDHLPQVYTNDDEIKVVGKVVSSMKFY
ncbi:helix-turn-helix domain-containing protein [Staphylococcus pseudintermedius]|uniref:LexA family protein n=1 Tax=Staphylococcus pseudintermedius TaxID=283734 RepID=UPI000CDEB47B|nr:XRE family transcriptional regulator [Staphylococcus pseudintermedius]EGQ2705946.1 helix-turn-helix domain-containing protein [Staphylococcus pseudintermedius]EHC9984746.1 helix-turn-helix domain-containing protein [Staphylococcus pseudintermedius]EIQ0621532.1 helix-turn-helix domain-containing protein [Staphylococcus pseudintermedius]EKH2209558.1 helix-turn-helix domain-containing protein [Staphylococcus pseudintermedius]EKS1584903.1 helix-turn-helix domain-containing protein [Staphylococc